MLDRSQPSRGRVRAPTPVKIMALLYAASACGQFLPDNDAPDRPTASLYARAVRGHTDTRQRHEGHVLTGASRSAIAIAAAPPRTAPASSRFLPPGALLASAPASARASSPSRLRLAY